MKIGEYKIGVDGTMGHYDCNVEETYDNNETYYQVDIKAPYAGPDGKTPAHFQIAMHFDSEIGGLKIKDAPITIPGDVLELESRLSDLICDIHS